MSSKLIKYDDKFPIEHTWKSIDYGPVNYREDMVDISQISIGENNL